MAWVGPISEIAGRRVRGMRVWALALALFAVALLVRFALGAWLDPIAFLTFYPTIVAATLLCGWRPGATVAVVAALAGWYLYLERRGSFGWNARRPLLP